MKEERRTERKKKAEKKAKTHKNIFIENKRNKEA